MPSPDTAEKAWDERNEEGLRKMSWTPQPCAVCGGEVKPNAEGRIICDRLACIEKVHEITFGAFRDGADNHDYEPEYDGTSFYNYCARCGNVKEHEIHG